MGEAGSIAQVVECLLRKCKGPEFKNPSREKKRKKKEDWSRNITLNFFPICREITHCIKYVRSYLHGFDYRN
jgi:hypothetical protein